MLVDGFGRPFRTLRVSVTARCNLACAFCHNEGQGSRVASAGNMASPELDPAALRVLWRAAAHLDVQDLKLTGGEPLLRTDLPLIISDASAAGLRVSLTTNGTMLAAQARGLAAAGLGRVNVSMDSVDPARYRAVRGTSLDHVLSGVDAAVEAGLTPVKLNAVVQPATADQIDALISFAANRDGLELQLIQFMPEMAHRDVGSTDVDALRARLAKRATKVAIRQAHQRPRFLIDGVWVELVAPVANAPFCGACDRLRVTADGRVKGCINVNAGAPSIVGLSVDQTQDVLRDVVRTRRPFYPRLGTPIIAGVAG